jgi:multicomponent Na+:H+ antiporter subunit E
LSAESTTASSVSGLRQFLVLVLTLMLFWLMLMGSLDGQVLLVGLIASSVIALLFRSGLTFFTEMRLSREAIVAGFLYYGYFFKELVKSNFILAGVVLSPDLPINPGIVKVRTKLKSRMGRLMLANSITLTPGTLTVELDGEWLYVHWVLMEADDVEQATARIVAGWEHYLEVIYG